MRWATSITTGRIPGEAKKNLVRFADKEKKSILAPLALLKAALALEEANDLKGAIELYKRLEEKYADSTVADQIFFNAARACAHEQGPGQFPQLL